MRPVKMQRALEICVEHQNNGGLAYRKAWEKMILSMAVGVKNGVFWIILDGEYVSQFVPTVEDVTTSDWLYEW